RARLRRVALRGAVAAARPAPPLRVGPPGRHRHPRGWELALMKRHRKAGSFLLLAAVAVAIAALSPRPAALVDPAAGEGGRAEAVAVRGHVAAGFGRLVFDWQSPVDYAVHREPGGALAITFARPAEFALDPALRALAGYIRAAE